VPTSRAFETWAFQLPIQKSGHEPSTPLMNGSENQELVVQAVCCQRFATQGVLAGEVRHPPPIPEYLDVISLEGGAMKLQRISAILTVVNLALLAFLLNQVRTVEASNAPAVLRGRALESWTRKESSRIAPGDSERSVARSDGR